MAEVVLIDVGPARDLAGDLRLAGAEAEAARATVAGILAGAGRSDDVSTPLAEVAGFGRGAGDGLDWLLSLIEACDARYPPIRTSSVEGMTAFVMPFASRDEAERHAAGAAHLMEVRRLLASDDLDGATRMLEDLEHQAADQAWLGGFLRMLGPDGVDGLERELAEAAERIEQTPTGGLFGPVVDLGKGAWGSVTATLGLLRDLTVQVVWDPGATGEAWQGLGSGLWQGVQDPGQLIADVVDVDMMLANPARWVGGLVPDIAVGLLTGGAGAAATRGTAGLRGLARGARGLDELIDVGAGARNLDDVAVRGLDDALPPALGGGAAGAGGGPQRWSAWNGPGPLGEQLAETFRGASYTQHRLPETTTLYRVTSPAGSPAGQFWSRTPAEALQAQLDLALNPHWGNDASVLVRADVPAGHEVFEGAAAPQRVGPPGPDGRVPDHLSLGEVPGGGSQVVVRGIDPAWVELVSP